MKFTARIWKASVDDEVTNELDFHLEMRTRELVAAGWEPAAARVEALRRFGDLPRLNATCRAIGRQRDRGMRRTEYLQELKQDVTLALRQLIKNPGFAAVALLTLTLGIGATTAIYSAVHAVVLRPLPLPDPDRLMAVTELFKGLQGGVSAGNYTDTLARQTSFAAMSAVQYSSFNVADANAPERVVAARVTANYFDVFGAAPEIGHVSSRRGSARPRARRHAQPSHVDAQIRRRPDNCGPRHSAERRRVPRRRRDAGVV